MGKQINTVTVFSQLMIFEDWSDLCLTFLLQARSIINFVETWVEGHAFKELAA